MTAGEVPAGIAADTSSDAVLDGAGRGVGEAGVAPSSSASAAARPDAVAPRSASAAARLDAVAPRSGSRGERRAAAAISMRQGAEVRYAVVAAAKIAEQSPVDYEVRSAQLGVLS